MRLSAAVAVAVILVAGCGAEKAVAPKDYVAQQVRSEQPLEQEARVRVPARKLIRTVDLDLRVADPDAAAERVRELADAAGGYVSESNAYRVEGLLRYGMTIRIPVEKLDAVVGQLKALAVEVEREHLRTEDVTERFVDLEARLRTLRLTEEELQALLAESRSRGSKAEDIMAIYRHLTEIRTNIEQLQGQLNALDRLTTYSTVNLDLVPTEAARPLVGDRWRPSETVRGGLRALVRALELTADVAILLVIVVAPIGLLLGLAVWLMTKAIGALRRRRREGSG